ncbi:hypothetical protein KIW84_041020 [Lathyrus oleraceus]|uniref:Uncharacterized protein n=1 Tax=Pisum sativum TaxID=3888 RepID=A0A9D4XBW6_PEA|nr:hypothetical protein KIW84_041020 [Pisum sativum]
MTSHSTYSLRPRDTPPPDFAEGVEKTKEAIKVSKEIEVSPDVGKAKDSHGIRPGKGACEPLNFGDGNNRGPDRFNSAMISPRDLQQRFRDDALVSTP